MKTHIEYDDFGEYIENYEDLDVIMADPGMTKEAGFMKRALKKLLLVAAAMTVMFSTFSYASGTCAVKGCYKSAVYGGSYCKNHTCSKSGCKNFSADGTYCSDHQKKPSSGNSSSSESTKSNTCAISGCNKSVTGGSAYCYQHKCKHTGCKNYGSND